MAEEFKIGATLVGMVNIDEYLSPTGEIFHPDWSFQPFAASIRLADGTVKGQGFPIAKWRWNHLTNLNREFFKGIIGTGLSGIVYIHTPTNESADGTLTWGSFQAVAEWTPEDEDKQVDRTLGFMLTFTHLIEQEEA